MNTNSVQASQSRQGDVGIFPPAQFLTQIQELYRCGLCLQAYRMAETVGPVRQWRGPAARVLAGRIAMNLGAPRLGRIMHTLAFRQHPINSLATYYTALGIAERRGPLAAMEFHARVGENVDAPLWADAEPWLLADWLAHRAFVAACFRDFQTADALLDKAMELAPHRPWIYIEKSHVLEVEDCYDQALAEAQRSMDIQPMFRPGVQTAAHLLQILDRDDEALALLHAAADKLENVPVLWQLASLQEEMQRYGDSRDTIIRMESLCVFQEKAFAKFIAARRSDVAYHTGDKTAAIAFAKQSTLPWLNKIAQQMAQAPANARRVMLAVPFVRQHHMTCAPATLAALSRYWSLPADHLAMVEAICYDGTPAHSQRSWAENAGYVVREFALTWESAVALIDRGIPFTLATVEPANSHLQAVIGFDTARGTLIVRDPYRYYSIEFHAELTMQRYAATGPHCMALVPAAEAARLENLLLPDQAQYDLLHQINTALARHDRATARLACEQLAATWPDHRLTQMGKRTLAMYDSDYTAALAADDAMLALFPDDAVVRVAKLASLRALERHDQHTALLQAICQDSKCDPVFLQLYANDLRAIAPQYAAAVRLLNKALRQRPTDAASLHALAGVLWSQRKLAQATRLYRLCACVDDKNESAAESYFIACRHLRLTEIAVSMLHARYARFGKRSSLPARTLFWALETLDRDPEAFAHLEEALRLRADDSELLLYAANAYGRHGNLPRARALLAQTQGKTRAVAWLRTAAALDVYDGNLAAALEQWHKVREADPLANDANSAVARLLAQTQSRQAALQQLQAVCQRFPHHTGLQQLRITWLREEGAAAAEPAIRELLTIRPTDAWAHRELALTLARLQRGQEALGEARIALELDPANPSSYYAWGRALTTLGKNNDARHAYRQTIAISVDAGYAMHDLLHLCATPQERQIELAWIHEQLAKQVIFGDGLSAWRDLACQTLESEEVLASLQKALDARPDLWTAWSCVVRQLADMNRLSEAETLARQFVERFALLPRAWYDLAAVCKLRNQTAAEIQALRQCLAINSGWSLAARELARALFNSGATADALATLERAAARDPLDADNHAQLARLLWRVERRADAVVRAKHALGLNLSLAWLWDTLGIWLRELNQFAELAVLARDLTQRRGGEATSWLVLAQVLSGDDALRERLAACAKAAALSPKWADAYDYQAVLLANAGRYDEALAACQPAALADALPINLRGRRAWIHARRGDRQTAIAQMHAMLDEDPHYYWGWHEYAGWLADTKQNGRYLQAAQDMCRLFAHDGNVLAVLAEAQLRSGARTTPKATLARVLQINPGRRHSLQRLYHLHLDDKELPQAQEVMHLMRRHMDGDTAAAEAIALYAAQKDWPAAERDFAKVCASTQVSVDAIRGAAESLDKAGQTSMANRILGQAVDKQQVRAAVAELRMQRLVSRKDWRQAQQILQVSQSIANVWPEMMVVYLNGLAQAKRCRGIVKVHRQYGAQLGQTTRLWATTSYALLTAGQTKRAAHWMQDWKQRQSLQPWMLFNVATVHRRLGKAALANDIHSQAVTLAPDHTTPRHWVWLAFANAAAGMSSLAFNEFSKFDTAKMPEYLPFVAELTRALIPLLHSDANIAIARYRISRAALAWPQYRKSGEYRRAFSLAVQRVRQVDSSLRTRLWAWIRTVGNLPI